MHNANKVVNDTTKKIINDLKDLLINKGSFIQKEDKRKLELRLRKFVRQNNLSLNPTLNSVSAVNDFVESAFKDNNTASSKDGITVSVDFLQEASTNFQMNLQPRSYQREKVASLEWKIEIMRTVLIDREYKIPAIHIRILRNEDGTVIGYEIADGQQRVSAILDFMKNRFKLPKGFMVGSTDLGGFNYSDIIKTGELKIVKLLKEYSISSVFYDNFTDEKISDCFINILNNTNDLVPQEKNNATRSDFSDFVRYTSRNGNGTWKETKDMFHNLFSRVTENENTDKEKTVWKWFAPKFKLGRMEGDNWLASLIYLYLNGLTTGVSPAPLTNFYKTTAQTSSHNKGWNFKEKMITTQHGDLKPIITDLLNIGLEICKAGKGKRERLVPNFLLFSILIGNEMKEYYNSSSVDWEKYTLKLYEVWEYWCQPSTYLLDENGNPRKQDNGKSDMGPFNALWGSPNSNVFKTAKTIVLGELKQTPSDWGFVELDSRKSFPKNSIERRLAENGGVDDYTGKSLSFEDAVGDHNIPRSWGINLGGVTEYHNLRVTTEFHNKRKNNRSGEQYKQYLEESAEAMAV